MELIAIVVAYVAGWIFAQDVVAPAIFPDPPPAYVSPASQFVAPLQYVAPPPPPQGCPSGGTDTTVRFYVCDGQPEISVKAGTICNLDGYADDMKVYNSGGGTKANVLVFTRDGTVGGPESKNTGSCILPGKMPMADIIRQGFHSSGRSLLNIDCVESGRVILLSSTEVYSLGDFPCGQIGG